MLNWIFSYCLYVIEIERRSFAIVLDGFGGKGFISSIDEIELCEHVRVLRSQAISLQNGDSHGEIFANFQMMRQIIKGLLFLVFASGINFFLYKAN